jgi:thiamine-phosphate pyrophosphorylase
MLRCAITDGTASGFVEAARIGRLQNNVRRWAADGIDLIQLREKSLDAGALLELAEAALDTLREMQSAAKLLINTRVDVAIAARAHGVHLTSDPDELTPQQVRELFTHAGLPPPIISLSCHTPTDIARARHNAADFILFGPVFEKRIDSELVSAGTGLEALGLACAVAQQIPVLALGGITPQNSAVCLAAGAAGIAGIRLFSA